MVYFGLFFSVLNKYLDIWLTFNFTNIYFCYHIYIYIFIYIYKVINSSGVNDLSCRFVKSSHKIQVDPIYI